MGIGYKLLAIDPGSQVTGYAVLSGLEPDELLDAGLLKPGPDRPADPQTVPESIRPHLSAPELAAYRRMDALVLELRALVCEQRPEQIVIEVPSGRIGTGARRGARGSLTIYGAVAGMMYECCRRMVGETVPVTERQWTAGRGDKASRQRDVALFYRGRYPADQDPGGDAADAIGLGLWWLSQGEAKDGGS